ncbi:MAG: glycosyltransferase family 39 protein [Gemmatimonadetes bacterium]|nr:glycosyltransferase family 39 protein [Gemmatimonadota bacterium]
MSAIPRSARFAAILLLALGLRVWSLHDQSLTMDEISELRIAHGSAGSIVQSKDGFPPLYHLLLSGWMRTFDSESSARWLAVFFGVLSIAAVERLGSRVGRPAVGLWSGALLAISPFHIWYSQEGRSYGLFFLLATLALWTFLRALETDRRRDWALYALTAVAGLYTHYFFALLLAVAAFILALERRGWGEWRSPLAAHVAIAVLALPLIPLLEADFSYQAGYPERGAFGAPAFAYTYVSLLTGYSLGPSLRELHVLAPGTALRSLLPWLIPLGAAAAVLLFYGYRELGRRNTVRRLLLLALLPVLAVGLLSELGGVGYNVRYVLWVGLPFVVWLGAGAARGWRQAAGRVGLLTLLILFGVALYQRHQIDRYKNEDTRAVAAYLQSKENRFPVLVISSYMAAPLSHYLEPGWPVYGLSKIESARELDEVLASIDRLAPHPGPYWLVYTRAFHGDPKGRLLDLLTERDGLRLVARFAGIDLYRSRDRDGSTAGGARVPPGTRDR